jgi:hypothetical protein
VFNSGKTNQTLMLFVEVSSTMLSKRNKSSLPGKGSGWAWGGRGGTGGHEEVVGHLENFASSFPILLAPTQPFLKLLQIFKFFKLWWKYGSKKGGK